MARYYQVHGGVSSVRCGFRTIPIHFFRKKSAKKSAKKRGILADFRLKLIKKEVF
jgi:hypothetical protein